MASINRPIGRTYHREASYAFSAERMARSRLRPVQAPRRTVWPFTDKQIELVQSFAERLSDEIQDKNRQLAEGSQHKSQFVSSVAMSCARRSIPSSA